MFSKKQTTLTTVGAAALACLLVAQVAWTDRASESRRLEGAWIAKVPGTPLQWTYTMTPDPSGREAVISGSIQVPVPPGLYGAFTDVEYVSPMVGQAARTSRNTADFTAVWYGLKKGAPFDQVVFIGVTSGQIKFKGAGTAEVAHRLAFYAPSADADGDGLPDPGQPPVLCLPATSMDTRLSLLPPCTP